MRLLATIFTTVHLAGFAGAVNAQSVDRPAVPCIGCDLGAALATPETGAWYNPDQSGSGFVMEVQNKTLVAYYFGYNIDGDPEWILLTATLTESSTPGVMWEAEGQPLRFSGGSCLGCDYIEPSEIEETENIRLEFLQRGNLKLIAGATEQFMVPIVYGSSAKAYFPEFTEYKLPTLDPEEIKPEGASTPWIFTVDSSENPGQMDAYLVSIGAAIAEGDDQIVSYGTTWTDISFGTIRCGPALLETSSEPVCLYEGNLGEFVIPLANFTDTRITGASPDDRVRFVAYRLAYD